MITLSQPKPEILARRDSIVAELGRILPPDSVIGEPTRLKPYETDGLAAYGRCRSPSCCRAPPPRWRPCCATAMPRASAWCRAAPAPRWPGARCRWRMRW
jgi:hypothetical protein